MIRKIERLANQKFLARLPYIAFALVIAGLVAAISLAGWAPTWEFLNLPTLSPVFADLRVIQAGYLSYLEGFNPQVSNPYDAWGRPMNYPSVWLGFAKLTGLASESNFILTALAIVFAYLVTCLQLLRQHPSLWLVAMFASGASMLAMERCNIDLVVFALLFVTARYSKSVGAPMLGFLALLKIFPVLAAPAVLRSPGAWLTFISILAGVAFLLLPEVAAVRAGTPVSPHLSYGAPSIAALLKLHDIYIDPKKIAALYVFFAFGAALPMLLLHDQIDRALGLPSVDGLSGRLFCVGAMVFVGSSILSSNWDYRLIFLLFCAPWVLNFDGRWVRWGIFAIFLISLNQPLLIAAAPYFGDPIAGLYLNVVMKFCSFLILSFLLGRWLRELAVRFLGAPLWSSVRLASRRWFMNKTA